MIHADLCDGLQTPTNQCVGAQAHVRLDDMLAHLIQAICTTCVGIGQSNNHLLENA